MIFSAIGLQLNVQTPSSYVVSYTESDQSFFSKEQHDLSILDYTINLTKIGKTPLQFTLELIDVNKTEVIKFALSLEFFVFFTNSGKFNRLQIWF